MASEIIVHLMIMGTLYSMRNSLSIRKPKKKKKSEGLFSSQENKWLDNKDDCFLSTPWNKCCTNGCFASTKKLEDSRFPKLFEP